MGSTVFWVLGAIAAISLAVAVWQIHRTFVLLSSMPPVGIFESLAVSRTLKRATYDGDVRVDQRRPNLAMRDRQRLFLVWRDDRDEDAALTVGVQADGKSGVLLATFVGETLAAATFGNANVSRLIDTNYRAALLQVRVRALRALNEESTK